MFNVIAAIYVENTIAAAKFNELLQKHSRLQDEEMFNSKIQQLLVLVHGIVTQQERKIRTKKVSRYSRRDDALKIGELMQMQITPELFAVLCDNARFSDILAELDVSKEDRISLFETLDVDGGGSLDMKKLVSGIAKLRGDPRRADIIEVGLTLRSLQTSFQEFEHDMRKDMVELLHQRKLSESAAPKRATC
mmetsp:Transcript_94764/g.267538  ORF Transcript_94764/g.267538 Transcript_94764/m.267538 type:complete len:192 (+) Transcript_94764:2-577(+)